MTERKKLTLNKPTGSPPPPRAIAARAAPLCVRGSGTAPRQRPTAEQAKAREERAQRTERNDYARPAERGERFERSSRDGDHLLAPNVARAQTILTEVVAMTAVLVADRRNEVNAPNAAALTTHTTPATGRTHAQRGRHARNAMTATTVPAPCACSAQGEQPRRYACACPNS